MPSDPPLPPVFSRAAALEAGLSRHQITRRVSTGRWRTLRRGFYTPTSLYDALSARDQHLLALVAALRARGRDNVASHLSAANAYGWTLPLSGAGPVTVTDGRLEDATRRLGGLVVQVASLGPADVTSLRIVIAGTRWAIPITTPSRTVADNLRHLSLPDGVALGDCALRTGDVEPASVARALSRQATWPYADNGRRALAMLDGRRESWLESFSFVTLHHMGLPMPEPQVRVYDRSGRFVARVDGWLEDEAVALEVDGRDKYFIDTADGVAATVDQMAQAARRRVLAEKVREDGLRDLGVELARWGTHDITTSPRRVLGRVEAARRRGDRSRFTGRTSYQQFVPRGRGRPA